MKKVKSISENYKIYTSNSLEEYRADSFFTKEPETVAWIDSFKRNETFFDIGANIGIYSLYASLKHFSKTYCFEPYHKNYLRLIDNIALNNIQDRCLPFFLGLHNTTKIESLFVTDERTSSSGHQVGTDIDEYGNKFAPVQEYPILIFSLDDFIRIYNVNIPNYIKIDVDGVEGEIIRGMYKTLANPALKSVCIELNRGVNDSAQLFNIFKKFGFTDDNKFNKLSNHSRFRRMQGDNPECENVIFTR